MSAALEISVASPALQGLEARIRLLAKGMADAGPLLEALGAELESQTRRRIGDGGPAPDGTGWQEWSDRYAKTRHANQGKLFGEGSLLDSIQFAVDGNLVEVGSNLIYAAIHQFGGTGDMAPGPAAVPAREWLGVASGSREERELDAIVGEHFGGIVREALA